MALFGVNLMSPLGSDIQTILRSSGAIDIEEEADFVDQIILKVGTSADLFRIYCDHFSKEYQYSSFIPKKRLQNREASILLTEAERVDYAQKHFTGISSPSEVLNSKSCGIAVLFSSSLFILGLLVSSVV